LSFQGIEVTEIKTADEAGTGIRGVYEFGAWIVRKQASASMAGRCFAAE